MALQFPSSPQPPSHQQNQQNFDNSPYVAPQANMESYHNAYTVYNDSKIFSMSGRIGRIQYIAYPLVFVFIIMAISMVFGFMAGGVGVILSSSDASLSAILGSYYLISLLLGLANFVFLFIHTIRRLNDMNRSGWFSLVLLIPIINLIFILALWFIKGTDGENDYGLPPPPPSMLLKIMVGVMIAGVIATLLVAFTALAMFAKFNEVKTETEVIAESVAQAQIDAQNAQQSPTVTQPAEGGVSAPETNNNQPALNQETIVFTAEDLAKKSGMPMPTEANPVGGEAVGSEVVVPPPAVNVNSEPVVVQPSEQVVIVNQKEMPVVEVAQPVESNQQNQGDMSYDEFLKMSEKPVFAD